MYLRYENGCVYSSSTGKQGSFIPLFFCDELTWQQFLFDSFSDFRDYEDDPDDFYDPFDSDLDF